jgi:phosphate acyltransferase
VVKAAHVLFRKAGFNFHGNLEGRDLPAGASERGAFDVVICDGFVGNVVLKFYEAVAPLIVRVLSEHPRIDANDVREALERFDSTNYGGAPLLGVRGVSIICHGNSPPRAIKNAIKVAVRAVDTKMNEQIGRKLEAAEPMITAAAESA